MKPLCPIIFRCEFDQLAASTIVFDRNEYVKHPGNICLAFQWTGDKSTVAFSEYLRWMHTVFAEFAALLEMPFSQVICYWQQPYGWEFWEYFPNGKKRLINRGKGQFDLVTPESN